jgi:hypothetical protein
MNMNDTTHTSKSEPGWHLLSQLDLPVGININDTLRSWLLEVVNPLNLPIEFLNRLSISIQDSISRALECDPGTKIGRTQISVFMPHDLASNGKNWGYFHTEKNGGRETDGTIFDHRMDIYLYVEG